MRLATSLGVPILAFALSLEPSAAFAGPVDEGDGDGIPDVLDSCTDMNNSLFSGCDSDQDGYGNGCDPDFDQTFVVNSSDFGMHFVPSFKSGVPAPTGTDMDCNDTVNSTDFGMFFVPKFKGLMGGAIPGPSGLSCAGTVPCS